MERVRYFISRRATRRFRGQIRNTVGWIGGRTYCRRSVPVERTRRSKWLPAIILFLGSCSGLLGALSWFERRRRKERRWSIVEAFTGSTVTQFRLPRLEDGGRGLVHLFTLGMTNRKAVGWRCKKCPHRSCRDWGWRFSPSKAGRPLKKEKPRHSQRRPKKSRRG